MSFTIEALDAMLAGYPGTHLSAHTAYSAAGANEVTGGTPAYARKAVTYGAPVRAARTASNTPTFDIGAGVTVRWIGKWDAASGGTFLGMEANGGTEQKFSVDLSAHTVKVPAHGFAANQKVAFYGDTVPRGLSAGAIYFAVAITADTFQVSATSGGIAIALNGEPGRKCVVSAIIEETFGAQGTLAVSPHSIRLDA